MRRTLLFFIHTCVVVLILVPLSTFAQTNRYYGNDFPAAAAFSSAVAVDGDTVLVGEGGNTMTSGIVYLFTKSDDGEWKESSRLMASDAVEGDGFGSAMVLDGSTLLVSAPNQNDGKDVVYVFTKSASGDWMQSGRLVSDSLEEGDAFGSAMALQNNTLLLGASAKFSKAGAVYVFSRDAAGVWSEEAILVASDSTSDDVFGTSVAIDGDFLFVGAIGKRKREGVVYLFFHDGDSWTEVDQLHAFGLKRNNRFGSVIAANQGIVLISAPRYNRSTGAVFTFEQDDDGDWGQTGTLMPFDASPNMRFGSSIAFAGRDVWVGAPVANRFSGAIYAISRDDDGNWTSSTKITSEEAARGARFAGTLAAGNGVAVVGMPGASSGAGAAMIFENGGSAWAATAKIEGDMEGYDSITGGQTPCDDGSSARFSCDAIDLVSFLSVKDLGAPRGIDVNDVWGWTDPVTGNEYALVGRQDALAFVDISDAQNPVYLGELIRTEGSPTSVWRDVKVYKDYAFIVADGAESHGMQIFDLTKLRNVENAPVVFEEDAHYDGIHSAHNIVINESTGFAYAVGARGGGETCGGGLHMINIQDPLNPVFAGCFADTKTGRAGTGYSHDAMCITYAGPDAEHQGREICFGANETAISISDVTDKENPIALSSATYPNVGYAHQGWITEDHKYFYSNDELDEVSGLVTHTRTLVWDVTDLDDPQLVNEFMSSQEASDHNLYVKGNYMYQSNYMAGLRILDIQDPVNPVEVGYFDTVPSGDNSAAMGGSWSNYPYFESGNLIVTSGKEGLFILKRREVDI